MGFRSRNRQRALGMRKNPNESINDFIKRIPVPKKRRKKNVDL